MRLRRSLKTGWSSPMMVWLILTLSLAAGSAVSAPPPTTDLPWAYQLLHDSELSDDCPICDRPTILAPMSGSFSLRLLDSNFLSRRYAVENISFTAVAGSRSYVISGNGTFQIGGEVALLQTMSLQVHIDDGFSNKLCYFTNVSPVVTRLWPMIDITLDQTNGTLAQTYSLRLTAAPLRELWFSTKTFFSGSNGPGGVEFFLSGDLLSNSGRVVKRNGELFSSVGIHVPGPDLGLDAVDMLPGGEIAFSLGSSAPSDTLGPIHHGDLLSTRRGILSRNQDLLAAFMIQPPAPDVGLDAVHLLESGEILFSIQSNIFSERLAITLHRGDLLSNTGLVVRSNQQMLARFHPANPSDDYGLDALYVWSSGEIWFSTEDDFQDRQLGPISAGDLLSDQGYVVLRQTELLAAFVPTQDPPAFGLDALYVVTDDIPPAPGPRLSIRANPATHNAELTWEGQGRVFQVERADLVTGAFQPLSPVLPDLFYDDLGAITNRTQSYYRLLQW
jgi:hypothetical protein